MSVFERHISALRDLVPGEIRLVVPLPARLITVCEPVDVCRDRTRQGGHGSDWDCRAINMPI